MKLSLLRIVRCPDCGGRLTVKARNRENNEITEGTLICVSCGGTFPVIRSIPRFVPSDDYSRSFSVQWNLFARTQLDIGRNTSTRDAFLEKTGIKPAQLRGKVLEAGCGMGRFLDLISRRRNVITVGFDLSMAVEAAYKNIGARPNVHIVQADIMHLPFAKHTFDVVFSIGVLHHTPDPKRAFSKLVPLVKPRGRIAIWVYSRYRRPPLSDLYRVFTSRMPWSMVLSLSQLMAALYPVHKKVRYLQVLLPISMIEDRERRLLDTFDWYSPKYQFKFTSSEVTRWFKEKGVRDVHINSIPVSVSGRIR